MSQGSHTSGELIAVSPRPALLLASVILFVGATAVIGAALYHQVTVHPGVWNLHIDAAVGLATLLGSGLTMVYLSVRTHSRLRRIGSAERRSRDALRREEQILRVLMETTSEIMILTRPDGRIEAISRACAERLGVSRADAIGRCVFDLMPPETAAFRRIKARQILESRRPLTFQDTSNHRVLKTMLYPIEGDDGSVEFLAMICSDITDSVRAKSTLRERDRRYRSLFDHSPTATIELDLSRVRRILDDLADEGDPREHLADHPDQAHHLIADIRVLRVNNAAVNLFEADSRGHFRSNASNLVSPETTPAFLDAICGFVDRRLQYEGEQPCFTLGGKSIQVIVRMSRQPNAKKPWSRVLMSVVDITERKRLEQEVLHISDLERMRIGQDLHDSLGQTLTGAACLCTALKNRLADRKLPEAAKAAEIVQLITQSAQEARTLAHGLNPVGGAPDSLPAGIRQLAATIRGLFGVSCSFSCEGIPSNLDPKTAMHLYRIAQEATTNAVRHGRAKHIGIKLNADPSAVHLTITDNGRGLPDDLPRLQGLGINTMRYRASMLGGVLHLKKRPVGGTVVSCRVPVSGPFRDASLSLMQGSTHDDS